MDKAAAIKTATQYLKTISHKYKIERAWLFRSFAKGAPHPDSDIDLAIVFQSVDDIIDRQIELLQLRRDADLRIEPHPFAAADFTRSNPVVAEILKNGIELRDYVA